MACGARVASLHPTPLAAGEEVAAHTHQVVGVAVAEVQAQGLFTRRPLPLATERAVRHGALPHALGGEVACPEGPGLAHGLTRVRPRQQMRMAYLLLKKDEGEGLGRCQAVVAC